MEEIIELHGKNELQDFVERNFGEIWNEQEISETIEQILSRPSGTDVRFICRQPVFDGEKTYHKQQVIRVFHSKDK